MRIYWLAVFIGLAFALRFYDLGVNPPGFYVDEAAIGYNSFSILKTGHDEYGQVFPILLRSWSSFTPALAVYMETLPIALFGMSISSVRLGPAIWGTITVFVIGWLAHHYSSINKSKALLLAMLIMAINPSHVLFSRGFYESTLGLLLVALGLALLSRNKGKDIVYGWVLLGLASYAYHPQRLVGIAILIVYWLWAVWRKNITGSLVVATCVFVVIQIPLFSISLASGTAANLASKSWLSIVLKTSHPVFNFIHEFAAQYTAYFSPANLFIKADPDLQRSVPEISLYISWMVIPFALGLKHAISRGKLLLPLWTAWVIFPVAAALSVDPFSTLRAALILIPVSLVITFGMVNWSNRLILAFTLVCILGLYRSFFVLLPHERQEAWNYGYDKVFDYISSSDIPAVIDADKPVYILYLFFNHIDPRKVQELGKATVANYYDAFDWQNYYEDDRVAFRSLEWKSDIYADQFIVGSSLLVSSDQAKEHFLEKKLSILDGFDQELLAVYKTNPGKKCASGVPDLLCN